MSKLSLRASFVHSIQWWKPKALLVLSRFSCVRLCAILWTVAHKSHPWQEYWSGVPLPSPRKVVGWCQILYAIDSCLLVSVTSKDMMPCIFVFCLSLTVRKDVYFSAVSCIPWRDWILPLSHQLRGLDTEKGLRIFLENRYMNWSITALNLNLFRGSK